MMECAFGKSPPWEQFSPVLGRHGPLGFQMVPCMLQVRHFPVREEKETAALKRNQMTNFPQTPARRYTL